MRRLGIFLGMVFFILCSLGNTGVLATERSVYSAKVIFADEVIEQEGLKTQEIQVEILEGEKKGSTTKLVVPYDKLFIRQLRAGDKVKVAVSSIEGEDYYQFFDFIRARNYVWLFILFVVLAAAFLGFRGSKRLFPSILLVIALLVGAIPFSGQLVPSVLLCLLILAFVTALTSWLRTKNKLLVVTTTLSVIFCLVIGLLIFLGFSQASYVVPFIGSVTTLDENLYDQVVTVLILSILFIPAGGVINASIQISKHIWEEFSDKAAISLNVVVKRGLKVSQKISAGELNNLIIVILGLTLAAVFLVKEQYPEIESWDNGWIALQVIYAISSGISILLVSPITTFFLAALIDLNKHRSARTFGGQRRLNVVHRGGKSN
ncbi:MAG: YibE/F family protein [Candidatus Dojkabacteria bacterium]|nr:YibE/F family protein [Candidatus Dojkabacteria bacterium]